MFDKRERRVRKTLKHLSTQRVVMQLPHPVRGHNAVWVVELTPPDNAETADDLLTCLLRGWVEVVNDAVPTSEVGSDGSLPPAPLSGRAKPIYRMTDSGWSVVRGTHTLALWGMVVALISLAAAVVALTLDVLPAMSQAAIGDGARPANTVPASHASPIGPA